MYTPQFVLLDFSLAHFQRSKISSEHIQAVMTNLKERGIPFQLTCNNSLLDISHIVQHLQTQGVTIEDDDMLLASSVLAHHLRERTNRATIFLLGSQQVRDELERHGLRVIEEPLEIGYLCDFVVAGAFPDYAYTALRDAYRCFEAGAQFVAVDHYAVYTVHDEIYPAGGPTAAALSRLLNKDATFVASRDITHYVTYAAKRHEIAPEHVLVVTDASIHNVESSQFPILKVSTDETAASETEDTAVVHDANHLATVIRERFFPS